MCDWIAQTAPSASNTGPPLCPSRPGDEVSTYLPVSALPSAAAPGGGAERNRVSIPSIGNSGIGNASGGRTNAPRASSQAGAISWKGKPSRHRLRPGA